MAKKFGKCVQCKEGKDYGKKSIGECEACFEAFCIEHICGSSNYVCSKCCRFAYTG